MKQTRNILLFLMVVLTAGTTIAAQNISLAGQWRFQLDRADAGIAEKWFDRTLPDKLMLPGGLTEQCVGDPITTNTVWVGGIVDHTFFTAPEFEKFRQPGNVKVPFWLQPELYYAGASWFQRDFKIPADWSGKRVVLTLERPHWETRVWMDGKLIGTNNSLSTPHEYDLGQFEHGKHTLTIRVDNRVIVDLGENSHSISDHTQGNWNGIVGKIELRATPLVWVEDVQVFPNPTQKTARFYVRLGNATGHSGAGELSVGKKTFAVSWDANGFETNVEVELGADAQPWDEFHPVLQRVKVSLKSSEQDSREVIFGLRDIATDGPQFILNGRKIFFRGTLECCIFPKTGHPPTDLESWKQIIAVAKSHGLNMLRFHSWCPPEAAFVAADEMGFYYEVEIASWANQSTTLGDGKPVDAWLYAEAARILKAYGNHPSFLLMAYGNEPGGKKANPWLAQWVKHWKAADSRRLYTSGAGWPQLSENQFHVTPNPRLQGWGEELKSRINAKPPETITDYHDYIGKRTVPVISHEIGQWCVYPNFDEMAKYTGYLKPRNFEIFCERLEANGLGRLGKKFLLASGKLQALCYKEDIESALRTPGMGGFQLLDLHDFPGQGTAMVGVLDPFWEEKGYITAAEYRRFCNAVVPLARLPKRVFTTDEKLLAEIEVANFGSAALRQTVTVWQLLDTGGKVLAQGKLPAKDVAVGNGISPGQISIELNKISAPQQCKLVVGLAGTKFENDWDLWIYPAQDEATNGNVLVTAKFDDVAKDTLASGGKVLLTLPAKSVRNFDTAPVKLGFSSIFWNTAWTGRQAPTTLGILCNPKHPALAKFPTDYFSNWQWWYLLHRAGALRLDGWPANAEPVVRVIDDWVTARSLGLIVEANAGKGKIVVCGFDLTKDVADPVSLQMRRSLLDYMNSKKFKPAATVSAEQIAGLIAQPCGPVLQNAQANASTEQPDHEAHLAVDGDPATIWHSAWEPEEAGFPHELVVELAHPASIKEFTALPRQDGNQNGWIKEYEFYTSEDGVNWGKPAAKGIFSNDASLKLVGFSKPRPAKFIKLVAKSGYANGPWASLAELGLIEPNQTEKP